TLYWFGQIAPWTILLTPLLAPLVAALLLLGLLAAVSGCITPTLAAPLAPILGNLTECYIAAVRAADALPGTPVRALGTPQPWLFAITALAATGTMVAWRRRAGVVAAVGLFAAPWLLPWPRPLTPRLCLFAVGHGQACLLETPSALRIAIDCGSMQHPQHAARELTAALPVRALDWLVITHADQDHHNGVSALLLRVACADAILPAALATSQLAQLLREHGTAVHLLQPGGTVRPCAELTVSAPLLPPGATTNDLSLWARVEAAGTGVLLTGDAQALGTAAAIAQGIAVPTTVLVLPHHGRANPVAPALLRTVRPCVCLASAACADGETRLGALVRRTGRELWVTGQLGNLELRFGDAPTITAAAPRRALVGR
ncbi:MAG: ComEC/Rec2 family competence protein, partial [Planctomycetes bacterium]|nr:ComEC/Rec2 family competence protein [Planctomycetota bacterium]